MTSATASCTPPLVSVVLPTHNMARFLAPALESVLNQTYANVEVEVIDDGSTDNPRAAIAHLLDDPRVHFHSISQSGQARAKNVGIRAAKGAFVGFIDADDVWLPNKLEHQLPLFTRDEIGVVYTDFRRVDVDGKPLPTAKVPARTGRVTDELLIENFVTGMTAVVRRECFEAIGLFDDSLPMGIDYDLWLRISTKFEFAYLAEETYLYRLWPGQMSHNYQKRIECAMTIMRRFLEGNPGLVEKKVESLAWAHTYVYAGNAYAHIGERGAALRWYLTALQTVPHYTPAWKQIVKLAVRPFRRA